MLRLKADLNRVISLVPCRRRYLNGFPCCDWLRHCRDLRVW